MTIPARYTSPAAARLSVILPAKNEAEPLRELLPKLREALPEAEVVVVDDGSTDATADVAGRFATTVASHAYSMGNGAAIKTGARVARGDVLIFMDADGQHDPADVLRLISKLESGFDLVVGSRSRHSHASIGRRLANGFYNKLASYMTGQRVEDLTSGLRAARAERFREFLYLLPNGFSYPTTSTMAFFRAGYPVAYVPIEAGARTGKSHIRPLQDGLRFMLIIFKVGTLYSPLKLFFPLSTAFFLTGLGHYLYTYFISGRFTNMSALMFTAAVLIFLIGLVSEQITQLIYRPLHAEASLEHNPLKSRAAQSGTEHRKTGT